MNNIDFRIRVLDRALNSLPLKMNNQDSRILLAATAYVESKIQRRKQIGGPAVSFFQFEKIGIKDVLIRSTSKNFAKEAMTRHCGVYFDNVDDNVNFLYRVFQDEAYDVLAAIFARLNYWNVPKPIPQSGTMFSLGKMYDYYKATWRPGKPDFNRWPEAYYRALGSCED